MIHGTEVTSPPTFVGLSEATRLRSGLVEAATSPIIAISAVAGAGAQAAASVGVAGAAEAD